MNTNELNRILAETPDKVEWKETTSIKLKADLIEFFGEDFKDKDILEVGCHVGHTSRILSYLFKKVYAMNINGPLFGDRTLWEVNNLISENDFYKHYSVNVKTTFDKKFENIDYLEMDSYNQQGWPTNLFSDVSVVFIDAIHQYEAVLMDISNAIKLNTEYLVFDDYGLPWYQMDVKAAVDSKINDGTLEVVKQIGREPGTEVAFNIQTGPVLSIDWEGLICRIK
mgnify:FL=1|jgi:hypothetical protein|tara:strand:+ start:782 stop:1456 length:675 start_codon:yes stop_codon:yes gene_type:complete